MLGYFWQKKKYASTKFQMDPKYCRVPIIQTSETEADAVNKKYR